MKLYEQYLKRIFDIVFSLVMIVIISPLMLIIAVLVKVKLGSPIFFSQLRPGKDEKIFRMYKFRTMSNQKGSNGELLPDEMRLGKFGSFLRSTSLDELPELICVLTGNMSLVGPRPQLVCDMIFMNNIQRKRHSVRPGITGLAQINGRNAISWEEKFRYDLIYIENITFKNDLGILLKTVKKVFERNGINEKGMATAMDFGDYLLSQEAVTQEQYNEKQKKASQIISAFNELL